jgi:hypothetical protein
VDIPEECPHDLAGAGSIVSLLFFLFCFYIIKTVEKLFFNEKNKFST